MLLVDANYIHNGGGRILLNYLIKKLLERNVDAFFLFDSRCEPDFDNVPPEKKTYQKASVINRTRFYLTHKHTFTKVICLGNLPPPIRLDAQVYTYLQNLLYLDTSNYSGLERISLKLKSWYLRIHLDNTDFMIFQTEEVKKEFRLKYLFSDNQCLTIPFFENFIQKNGNTIRKKEQFLYVSDGNKHKNHQYLLKSWEIINQTFPQIELHLTVSKIYPSLVKSIQFYQQKGVNIINHGQVSQVFLNQLYQTSEYIIYPSLTETLGLGLIEGALAGCKPIVANQSYAKAVVEPYSTFNPFDCEDIVQKVFEAYQNPVFYENKGSLIKNEIEKLINLLH